MADEGRDDRLAERFVESFLVATFLALVRTLDTLPEKAVEHGVERPHGVAQLVVPVRDAVDLGCANHGRQSEREAKPQQ